ncbi:MAG: hypothetical protein Q4B77_00885 [Coriobacteriaceae bacterium]|nr:hypothetical protein [Coriobacteriaceae bacterium]
MSKKHDMTPEEAEELFSELDESGVLDPNRGAGKEKKKRRTRTKIDPLSEQDPSGSQVSKTISRTAILVILGVFALVLGMQIVYGVSRRLNTANLSDRANVETVSQAMESGVEWGNGFTQFPQLFEVDEASEKTGVIEVSVTDTDSKNELELLSNSQIQASALATNALLNDKINRVVYNVYTLVDSDGAFRHDRLFGFLPAEGTRRAMLTFVWTKAQSNSPSNIDWELKIVGMDDELAEAIQTQVNSVSSLAEDPGVTQGELDEERRLLDGQRLQTAE